MVSKEDIKKLADLARIGIEDGEAESLAGEIDAILAYLGQIKTITGEASVGVDVGDLRNVMREDTDPNESGAYSEALIAEFPESENNYLKVKKIL